MGESSLSADTVELGDPFDLRFTVEVAPGRVLFIPDSVAGSGFEPLGSVEWRIADSPSGRRTLSVRYPLIAFDVGTLAIPELEIFVGSMSAKYAMFAPIFIPMFMLVGISPELTQAAYRIGDSVSNIITPLNAYLVIVLVFLKKEMPRAGMGTLISTMLPYTVVFTIVWTLMLVVWMALGLPLGIEGPLEYQLPG